MGAGGAHGAREARLAATGQGRPRFTPWPCKQTCFILKRDTEGQEQTCSRSFKILYLLTVLWIRLKALGPGWWLRVGDSDGVSTVRPDVTKPYGFDSVGPLSLD